jgi:hypothetical protein
LERKRTLEGGTDSQNADAVRLFSRSTSASGIPGFTSATAIRVGAEVEADYGS